MAKDLNAKLVVVSTEGLMEAFLDSMDRLKAKGLLKPAKVEYQISEVDREAGSRRGLCWNCGHTIFNCTCQHPNEN